MQDQHALQSGSILDRYKIIRVLGEGGFGITYLAEDIQLGLKVVIKEYFPNEFAMRSGDSTITAKSKSISDFSKGMQRFKEEAKTLARFNHPSIVKILGYFEANDTAYFVMEYEEGIDLSQYLKQENKTLGQEEILSIMMPILEGLKEVHKYKYLHRDIKPGNILLRVNKSPVLIDFGASKLALGEASKSITSMLTEGYAPLEQYSTDIKQQGTFTDLYAVAAVMYKMITGEVPPSAQTRSYALLSGGNDPYKSLTILKLSQYDNNFLKAVDRALDINANKRPQKVQEFQADIAGKLKIQMSNSEINGGGRNNNNMIVLFLVLLMLIGGGYFFLNQSNNVKETDNVTKDVDSSTIKSDQESFEISKKEKDKAKIEAERLEKERNENLRKEQAEVKKKKLEKEKAEKERIETERLKKEQEEVENLRKKKIKAQKEEWEGLKKEEILKNKVVQRINKKAIEQKNEVNRKAVERTNSKKRIYQQKLQEWNEQISLVCSFEKGVYRKDIETIAKINIKAENNCEVFKDGSALCYDKQGKDHIFKSGQFNKNIAQRFNRDSYCSDTLDKCLYFYFDNSELINIEGCVNEKINTSN